jgi:Ca2+-binding RTX toxin-like protein
MLFSCRFQLMPRTRARRLRSFAAGTTALALLGTGMVIERAPLVDAGSAPVGQGLVITPSDLAFILRQIMIAERHALAAEASPESVDPPNPDPLGDPEYCRALVGPDPDQVPDYLTSYGLRTVDGACNNLLPARHAFGQADKPFPRLTSPTFGNAEPITAGFPVGPPGPTSYQQTSGSVVDAEPRVISNLIVDQTAKNPAAVAAAGFPVRSQGDPGVFPCTTEPATPGGTDGVPAGCVPANHTLFIPNVTTNVGLSPPYNSLFTFFGQFFDHGVDQTLKGGGGTVFIPLHADDPLVAGPDHLAGTPDDLPADLRFMVLTRAQNQPGLDGVLGTPDDVHDTNNSDSPWIDQSQTYSSHASHQVFLREYANNLNDRPVSTGKLLGGLPGPQAAGLSTWASTKKQAAELLGLELTDKDISSVPMIATDPYGKFIPGPSRHLPQYVTTSGLVEGCRAADVALPPDDGGGCTGPVPVPVDVIHFDTPFVTDIAHNADPSPDPQTGIAPIPDADLVASADFVNQQPGTYDDEMLDAHFTCGDGRCNENIALSAIHQVFHSEHDRLVDDIKDVLTGDTTPTGVLALDEWQTHDGWDGERLFQAARFINETEYQHLVFEEFARKVQPGIRVFEGYSSDIDPAIPAEFASAVYRFGHSMLVEDVARTNPDGSDNSTALLHAFLNPPELFNAHGTCNTPPCSSAGLLTPQQAAGAVIMGAVDQVGNELDEFVTETLRNSLLGLPLDLATLNLTRARDVGLPPLNDVRRQLFGRHNDGQLAPYTSWSDFGQHLKHPESLINFVAAYGTHPSIANAATLTAKRAAARAIVQPVAGDVAPVDSAAFMFGTGSWASVAGVTTTGLDDVDLWVGGLAEATNLNGGLLGSTFNYVFQTSLENLQDGDRFYYLARTAGMNMLGQLEGNSFAELIGRNTDGTHSLKADVFATADCKFQLANLAGTAAGFATFGATVADDRTTTDCNEFKLLERKPDGTIRYRAVNSVDQVGINGQSVYTGTAAVDRVIGGNDNDTFWGGVGNDIIDGNGGDDVALGGEGNDVITDSNGADTLKGGPGSDAIDGGPDIDLLLGGDAQDFLNGGTGDNVEFGGPGDDFVIAGTGADVTFGDGGDDWIEGSSGEDLLHGDHGAPFFDDPGQVAPGNDVFVGQVGGNDYDAEGGDDLMAQNAAIERNAGGAGFDWAFHQYDTVPANDDMNINNNLAGPAQPIIVNRDIWQETEAVSGFALDDVIKGTNLIHSQIGGAGTSGCDVLDQAGVDRIPGLAAIVPQPLPDDPAPVIAAAASALCPISGSTWGRGDILIGGARSDTLEGRGGDDIIDGDRFVQARLSVRDAFDPGVEIGSTDLMERKAIFGDFGPGTTNMTLQQAVFSGLVNPAQLVAVREVVTPTVPAPDCGAANLNCDTAVFSGRQSDYNVSTIGDAVVVSGTGVSAGDGADTLRNIEQLSFCDGTIDSTGRCNVLRTIVPLPAPAAVSPSAWNLSFPTLDPGDPAPASVVRSLTLTNRGGADATVSGGSILDDSTGSFGSSTGCSGTLTSGASCTIDVSYFPAARGPVAARLSIGSDAGTAIVVSLRGAGLRAPTITGVAPVVVAQGAPIVITGVDLASTASTTSVTIGGVVAQFTRADTTSLTATVPDAVSPAVTVPVVVTTAAGSATAHLAVTARPVTPPVVPPVTPPVTPPVVPPVTPPVTPPVVPPVIPPAVARAFAALYPFRAADTRPSESGLVDVPKAKVAGTSVLEVPLTGLAGIPTTGVAAISMNVTVVDSEAAGYVTAFPCGAVPATSSVNFAAGQVVANAVIAAVSDAGHVCFFSNVRTDVVVDVNGWYPAGAGLTVVTPARAFDTRVGQHGVLDVAQTKIAAGSFVDVPLADVFGSAVGTVAAVSMNVTVDGPSAAGFLTVYPCGTMPDSSSVNFVAGETVANTVIAPLSSSGHACFFASQDTDVIVDVNGWLAPGSGFTPVDPTRVFDTRSGQGGAIDVAKRKVAGAHVLGVELDNLFGSPAAGQVDAVSLNVTVDGTEGAGYVAVFPCGSMPSVSSVNFVANETVANAVIAPLSATGTVCFYSSMPTDLVVDVNGWFSRNGGPA